MKSMRSGQPNSTDKTSRGSVSVLIEDWMTSSQRTGEPMTKEENHLPDHFFQDVCICSCAECTAHEGEPSPLHQAIADEIRRAAGAR